MSDASDIVKSGALDKLADIIHKLAGPMAEEIGMMMADKIKVYRVKNWVSVVRKTEQILAEAHIPANAVPPRLFLPILEAASIENDETLQGLWAGLLASASEESDSLSPSFVETLKQLTPAEAKTLNKWFDFAERRHGFLGPANSLIQSTDGPAPHLEILTTETFERLGLIRREYDLQEKSRTFIEQFLISAEQTNQLFNWPKTEKLPEITYQFKFTEYGFQFMNACRGPRKQTDVP
jgi:hypothetical protein